MKKKIASMIVNVTNGYSTSDDDVSRKYGTKGILKMIDRRKLIKEREDAKSMAGSSYVTLH